MNELTAALSDITLSLSPLASIRKISPEILGKITSVVPAKDRIALAKADPRVIYPGVKAEIRAAMIINTHVPNVRTLKKFTALSNECACSIQALPKTLRAEPLTALAARIPRLPYDEQQPAIDMFLESAKTISEPRPALLDELVLTAEHSPLELQMREELAAASNGPAAVAIRCGQGVDAVIEKFGKSLHKKAVCRVKKSPTGSFY